MTGGSAAVQGISMLNPQRWGGGAPEGAYSKNFDNEEGGMLFEVDRETERENEGDNKTFVTSASGSKVSRSEMAVNQLDLLLSLDVALELIHADREALKRVEGFAGYPGHYGHRVRDTIEELFIMVLQVLGEQHIAKGFAQ